MGFELCKPFKNDTKSVFLNPPGVDIMQTFVKMVGANVTAMEEQVTQAEGELGTLPSAFKKIFRNMSVPNFLNVSLLRFNSNMSIFDILRLYSIMV